MTEQLIEWDFGGPSRMCGAEIRGELARQGRNQRWLAEQLHVNQAWVSRRITPGSDVEITLEELVRIAEALNVSVQRLVATWLPRLDSNQQPSGYPLSLVSGPLAEVVYLDERRAS